MRKAHIFSLKEGHQPYIETTISQRLHGVVERCCFDFGWLATSEHPSKYIAMP